ncbi:hypothetical protein O5O45_00125 [Hahella aquimaris]|uniref:hypothetical protein n=1 Tax=Hahella sp. HNIBRBA332 TaxID=3015983 RepID=UPI00273C7579|nr:hypothetical protein [Hahella sp. HNIBRBA332]WLQ14346.1 hypothetical protein O5O45_00125 [Hahella sp. HNIBRBA332]
MGFFGGPSKGTLLTMSQGIAAVAMQIQMLQQAESEEKEVILAGMRKEGAPTSMNELIQMAASVIREQDMGWYKKNQFLGMIFGSLVSIGFSMADANYIKGQIELLS